jgi:hypothetical protein
MMDVTLVRECLGGPDLHLASVFNAFSRVPLVVHTYERKPGASAMARLLKTATRAFGKAKYVITDQGGEFTARSSGRRQCASASFSASAPARTITLLHVSRDSGEHSKRPRVSRPTSH